VNIRKHLSVGESLKVSHYFSISADSVFSGKSLSVSDETEAIFGKLSVSGPVELASWVSIGSFCNCLGDLAASVINSDFAHVKRSMSVGENANIIGNLTVEGDASRFKGTLSSSAPIFSNGSISICSNIIARNISTSRNLNIGSILTVSSRTYVADNLSVSGALHLGDFSLYADNTRMITASPSGQGCFHGTWSFEVATTTSDRRLKRDITPLAKSFEQRGDRSGKSSSEWILEQLRPVSFKLNQGDEGVRFGFIAQVCLFFMIETIFSLIGAGEGHARVSSLS